MLLDAGTTYTVAQVGADTVINMAGGGQMVLVGVQMCTLTGDWIFGADKALLLRPTPSGPRLAAAGGRSGRECRSDGR